MHLKAYAIDGVLLRTGSANFSASGENAQDNDLIVIRDAGAAAKFDVHFERMWDAAVEWRCSQTPRVHVNDPGRRAGETRPCFAQGPRMSYPPAHCFHHGSARSAISASNRSA